MPYGSFYKEDEVQDTSRLSAPFTPTLSPLRPDAQGGNRYDP